MPDAPIRVLLVEDNPADARLVREALRGTGPPSFALVVADRLAAGVERLATGEFDVILADLSLPDSHGLETFNKIREEAHGIPILILTGLEDEAVGTRAVAEGAQDYVLKRHLVTDILPRAIVYALSRKELLVQLEDQVHALEASEERYRVLVDGLDAIVWEADLTRHRFSFVSHRMETMLGYPVSDFLENDNFWEQHVQPSDFERELERRKGGGGAHADHTFEYRIKAADGRWMWVRDVVRVLRDSSGKPSQLAGVMIDVSEIVAVQQYRENLIDVISHEFRTPVTIIQGYAQLLTQAKGRVKPEAAEMAKDRIRTASDHLAYLLGSITELSRLRSGGAPPHLEPLVARDVIKEAVAALTARGRSVENSVQIHISRGAERVQADRRKLLISLVELLDNAAKFSPPKAPIWVGARLEGQEVVITVEDKGPGIQDSVRDHLFRPFVQADMTAVRPTGGAGLGLAVVSGLVKAQGGRVEVDTVVGEGSAFHIVLPVSASAR